MKTKIDLGKIIKYGGNIYALAVALVISIGLPFYFKEGYVALASNKYLFFMTVSKWTAISFGILLLLRACIWGFTMEEIKAYKGILYLDIFVFSFGFLSLVSHWSSTFKTNTLGTYQLEDWFYEGSLWGTKGWYMGLMTYLCFILVYIVISRCLIYQKNIFIPILGATTIICTWGIMNRYGIAPINMNYDYKKGVFLASVGNINWFCGYTSVIVPLFWGLLMGKQKKWVDAILHLGTTITLLMIICNSSDSGYLALFVTMAVLFSWAIRKRERMIKFMQLAMILFFDSFMILVLDKIFPELSRSSELGFMEKIIGIKSLVVLILLLAIYVLMLLAKKPYNEQLMTKLSRIFLIVFALGVVLLALLITVNTLTDGAVPIVGASPYFIFNGEWGSRRGETWKLGVQTFIHMDFWHKLVGSGPDTFYYEMIKYSELADECNDFFNGSRLTNAHNEIITLLVNNGILGTATFIGIMVVAVKKSFEKAKDEPEYICFALAVISYTVNNMFSFQQITNIPFLFVILGIEAAALVKEPKALVLLTKKDKKHTMQKGKKSRK